MASGILLRCRVERRRHYDFGLKTQKRLTDELKCLLLQKLYSWVVITKVSLVIVEGSKMTLGKQRMKKGQLEVEV